MWVFIQFLHEEACARFWLGFWDNMDIFGTKLCRLKLRFLNNILKTIKDPWNYLYSFRN